MFAQLYDAGEDQQVSRDVLLTYELTSVHRASADGDGIKLDTKRVDLLHTLCDLAEDADTPVHITTIIGACALHAINEPALGMLRRSIG